jgi:hypothetical protein
MQQALPGPWLRPVDSDAGGRTRLMTSPVAALKTIWPTKP